MRSSGVSVGTPQLAAAAAADDDDRGYRPDVRGSVNVSERSEIDYEVERNVHDDDCESLPLEELLRTELQEEGCIMANRDSSKTGQFAEADSRGRWAPSTRVGQCKASSQEGLKINAPIILLEDSYSSTSKAGDVKSGSYTESAAPDGLVNSQGRAIDSTTSDRPPSSDSRHDVDDFCEQSQLAEEDSLGFDCLRPYTFSSRPWSETSHDPIGAADQFTNSDSSESTMFQPARRRDQPLSHVSAVRSAADEYEQICSTQDGSVFEQERGQHEEQDEDGRQPEDDEEDDRQLQQEVEKDTAPRNTDGNQWLADPSSSPEPNQNKFVSHHNSSCSDRKSCGMTKEVYYYNLLYRSRVKVFG